MCSRRLFRLILQHKDRLGLPIQMHFRNIPNTVFNADVTRPLKEEGENPITRLLWAAA